MKIKTSERGAPGNAPFFGKISAPLASGHPNGNRVLGRIRGTNCGLLCKNINQKQQFFHYHKPHVTNWWLWSVKTLTYGFSRYEPTEFNKTGLLDQWPHHRISPLVAQEDLEHGDHLRAQGALQDLQKFKTGHPDLQTWTSRNMRTSTRNRL